MTDTTEQVIETPEAEEPLTVAEIVKAVADGGDPNMLLNILEIGEKEEARAVFDQVLEKFTTHSDVKKRVFLLSKGHGRELFRLGQSISEIGKKSSIRRVRELLGRAILTAPFKEFLIPYNALVKIEQEIEARVRTQTTSGAKRFVAPVSIDF